MTASGAGGSVPGASAAPRAPVPAASHGWAEHKAPDGRPYYYNAQTKVSTYDKPVELKSALEKALECDWTEHKSAASAKPYFYNKVTKESTWTEPKEYAEFKLKLAAAGLPAPSAAAAPAATAMVVLPAVQPVAAAVTINAAPVAISAPTAPASAVQPAGAASAAPPAAVHLQTAPQPQQQPPVMMPPPFNPYQQQQQMQQQQKQQQQYPAGPYGGGMPGPYGMMMQPPPGFTAPPQQQPQHYGGMPPGMMMPGGGTPGWPMSQPQGAPSSGGWGAGVGGGYPQFAPAATGAGRADTASMFPLPAAAPVPAPASAAVASLPGVGSASSTSAFPITGGLPPPVTPAAAASSSVDAAAATAGTAPSSASSSAPAAGGGGGKDKGGGKSGKGKDKYNWDAMSAADRAAAFRELLRDKGVRPDTRWGDALPGLEKDRRFAALRTLGERKQAFAEFASTRGREEREEKRRRAVGAREAFTALLASRRDAVGGETRYRDAEAALGEAAAWRGVEDAGERAELFDEFVAELGRRERDEARRAAEGRETAFLALLRARPALVTTTARWADVKGQLADEPAYAALDKGERLRLYRDHVLALEAAEEAARAEAEAAAGRRRREAQAALGALLAARVADGRLTGRSRWEDFKPALADEARSGAGDGPALLALGQAFADAAAAAGVAGPLSAIGELLYEAKPALAAAVEGAEAQFGADRRRLRALLEEADLPAPAPRALADSVAGPAVTYDGWLEAVLRPAQAAVAARRRQRAAAAAAGGGGAAAAAAAGGADVPGVVDELLAARPWNVRRVFDELHRAAAEAAAAEAARLARQRDRFELLLMDFYYRSDHTGVTWAEAREALRGHGAYVDAPSALREGWFDDYMRRLRDKAEARAARLAAERAAERAAAAAASAAGAEGSAIGAGESVPPAAAVPSSAPRRAASEVEEGEEEEEEGQEEPRPPQPQHPAAVGAKRGRPDDYDDAAAAAASGSSSAPSKRPRAAEEGLQTAVEGAGRDRSRSPPRRQQQQQQGHGGSRFDE